MKKFGIVLAGLFLVFSLFGLACAQEQGTSTAQPGLTNAAYVSTMLGFTERIKNIIAAKFMYASKEVAFLPKKDVYGNAAAINYYSAEKSMLEEIKANYSAITPPSGCAQTHEMFSEVLDTAISIFDKAIEANQKDDASIIDKERAPLLKKYEELVSAFNQKLQEIR
ncbi:MAG: hypothetical protein NTW18_01615 [Candidatus Omnitrophica bacterium]|nr:hypothetical protein [Candidatus Omnitrophota bacterium]